MSDPNDPHASHTAIQLLYDSPDTFTVISFLRYGLWRCTEVLRASFCFYFQFSTFSVLSLSLSFSGGVFNGEAE